MLDEINMVKNEALASRFVVILMLEIASDALVRLLKDESPQLKVSFAADLARIFVDIQKKTANSKISSRLLDLRGLLDSVQLMRLGIYHECLSSPAAACQFRFILSTASAPTRCCSSFTLMDPTAPMKSSFAIMRKLLV